jgi:hypothetical protein
LGPSLIAALVLSACGGGKGAGETLTGTAGSLGSGTAGSGTPGTAGGPPGTAGGGSGTAGTPGTGGTVSPGTAGMPDVGLAGPAECNKYCTAIMSACTGANAQYSDMADCVAVCEHLPAGAQTDATGNTIGCRTTAAATAAAQTTAVKDACWAAGPLGFGTCGNECDVMCPIILSVCGASAGYASADDCHNICSLFNHQVDFTMPGHYSANYTQGPDPMTADTLDCRAYHLFVKALANPANVATECPNVATKSPACGPGPDPSLLGGGGDGGMGNTGDGSTMVYTGKNTINPTNWDETKYPPNKRKMLLRDEGDPKLVMIDLSKTPILVWKGPSTGDAWARSAQLIGNNEILGGRINGYEVYDYNTGATKRSVTNFPNSQSAYRLATGETMLTRSGTVLTFLDASDKMTRTISYPGHGYVRLARPTRNGTFLVPSDQVVFEGDATGKVLWSLTAGASGWGHIWEPLLLGPPVGGGTWNDGDTLLCNAFGQSCDIIDKNTHKVTFRFGKNLPAATNTMVHPNFFSEFEILPNGNLFVANWQGHGAGNGNSGTQVLEFDPKGNLSWFWKQDATIFSSIQGVQSMDGKNPMYLHVEETSTDSTWQPVMTQ